MKRNFFAAITALGLGVTGLTGVAHAASPAAQHELSESVAVFPERNAPVRVAPMPAAPPHLPAWESGFSSPEQLRNEMLSHGGWGSG